MDLLKERYSEKNLDSWIDSLRTKRPAIRPQPVHLTVEALGSNDHLNASHYVDDLIFLFFYILVLSEDPSF